MMISLQIRHCIKGTLLWKQVYLDKTICEISGDKVTLKINTHTSPPQLQITTSYCFKSLVEVECVFECMLKFTVFYQCKVSSRDFTKCI